MPEEVYTVWGFWITVAGTILGFLSYIYAIIISRTTKRIRDEMIDDIYKNKFKKSKNSILKALETARVLIDKDDQVDAKFIEQTLYDIEMYKRFISKRTLKITKKILKLLKRRQRNKYILALENKLGKAHTINDSLYGQLYKLESHINLEVDDQVDSIRGKFK